MIALLDDQHSWPCEYIFKFVVKAEKVNELKDIVGEEGLSFKMSSQGKYLSLTIKRVMNSGLEVVEFYEKAYSVDGIITL